MLVLIAAWDDERNSTTRNTSKQQWESQQDCIQKLTAAGSALGLRSRILSTVGTSDLYRSVLVMELVFIITTSDLEYC